MLHAVLVKMESDKAAKPVMPPDARTEVPQNFVASNELEEMTELRFEQTRQQTRGTSLFQEIHAASADFQSDMRAV